MHYLAVVCFQVMMRAIAGWAVDCEKNDCLVPHIFLIILLSLSYLIGFALCPFKPTAVEIFFLGALAISMHTDACQMVLWRIVTLIPLPFMYLAAYYNLLSIPFLESIIASIAAYFFLLIFGTLYHRLTGNEGLGAGDKELLAFIGAGIGFGWWHSMLIACWLGIFMSIMYGVYTKNFSRSLKIPFGTFLGYGATLYFFWIQCS